MPSDDQTEHPDIPSGDEFEHDPTFDETHPNDHLETTHHTHHAVFGDPSGDKRFWHAQTGDYTCAVEAQAGILECLTGEKVTELDAAVESAQLGLLTTSGTLPQHIGSWLEEHNVECHSNDNGTFVDVIRELRDGNKVIVGVNSESLWTSNDSLHAFASQAKDHAIWLTGVDASDPRHVKVTINDSGKPDGAGNVYDLHDLEEVLNCPGFHYVATGHGPSHLPENPAGFDSHDGIFHGLDEFLLDHALPIAGVSATAAFAAAKLASSRSSPNSPPKQKTTTLSNSSPNPALPSPAQRIEDMSREERDQALRNL